MTKIDALKIAESNLDAMNEMYKAAEAECARLTDLLKAADKRIAAYDRALYRAGGRQYDCEMCVMRLPEHKDVDCIGKCEEYWQLDENLFIGDKNGYKAKNL